MKVKLEKQRKIALNEFQAALKIQFKDIFLLNKALTHSSYAHEVMHNDEHNERLKFLGDSILSYIIVEYLYKNFDNLDEGELSKLKSYIVSENILHSIANNINLHKYLLLGKGEELTGGREKKSLISDAVEGLIGAYFLDRGLKKAKKLVIFFLKDYLSNFDNINDVFDFKSQLQEYIQKRYKKNPLYTVIKEDGPEHKKIFEVAVMIDNDILGPGIGPNKKWAEKAAAKDALSKIGD